MSVFRNRRVLDRLSGAVVQTKDKAEVGYSKLFRCMYVCTHQSTLLLKIEAAPVSENKYRLSSPSPIDLNTTEVKTDTVVVQPFIPKS